MRTVLFQFVKPMNTWPLVWEPMVLRPLYGPGRRQDVDVPFRRCPHRGYFFDEIVAPPRLLNAWGVFHLPSCEDEWCRMAYRQRVARP
jgi:hypothetical protein